MSFLLFLLWYELEVSSKHQRKNKPIVNVPNLYSEDVRLIPCSVEDLVQNTKIWFVRKHMQEAKKAHFTFSCFSNNVRNGTHVSELP